MIDLNGGSTLTEASTAVNDALTKLSRLGRIADAAPILEDARAVSYNHILEDSSRTEEWRTGATAKAYTDTMNNVARRLGRAVDIANTQNADDSSRVFGVKGLTGDPAGLTLSRRDAIDRAAKVTDPRERQAVMADALNTGDQVYARALLQNAVQSGDITTVNQYSDAHPMHDYALQRLWNAAQSANNNPPRDEIFEARGLRPRSLEHLADFQISSRAAEHID